MRRIGLLKTFEKLKSHVTVYGEEIVQTLQTFFHTNDMTLPSNFEMIIFNVFNVKIPENYLMKSSATVHPEESWHTVHGYLGIVQMTAMAV